MVLCLNGHLITCTVVSRLVNHPLWCGPSTLCAIQTLLRTAKYGPVDPCWSLVTAFSVSQFMGLHAAPLCSKFWNDSGHVRDGLVSD